MSPDIARPELRAYLLGTLDETRAEALEVRYVAEPALVDEIRDEEDALIADYLADRLTAIDRARIDAHYLASPVHRNRLAVARALADRQAAAGPRPSATPAFYGWMAMAAAVVLMSLWITARPGPAPQQAETPPAPAPAPVADPRATAPPVAGSPGPQPPGVPAPPAPAVRAVFAITLSPMLSRGASAQPAHRPPAGPVDLVIRLEGTPAARDTTYDVEWQTVEGETVSTSREPAAPAASGLLLTLRRPVEDLPPGDYVIVVRAGDETRGEYVLRLRAGPRAPAVRSRSQRR